MSVFWSAFIIFITALNILGSVWLLMWTAKNREGEPAEAGTTETTGHVWDEDLTELNNPLPRWWLWLFVITVVFSVGYLVLYPGLGSFDGVLGWTQEKQYERQLAELKERQQKVFGQFEDQSIEALAGNDRAMEIAGRLYANNCATCHGSDARGAKGYPNLRDDAWLYGGTPEVIRTSIENGRQGVMPGFGQMYGIEELDQLTAYVYLKSGRSGSDQLQAQADKGEQLFRTQCAACHGQDGTGNTDLGAPDLTDDAWVYGGDFATIRETIRNGRENRMPAHKDMLDPTRIRLLTAWVWQLDRDGN